MHPPHNVEELVEWLTVISVVSGFIWWIVNSTITNPLKTSIENLDTTIKELSHQLRKNDERLDQQNLRIKSLEVWREIKEKEQK